jgi:hypothetical protein
MKPTSEELKKWIKGIAVDNKELDDKDFYDELDKDDCLGRTYPGVEGKDKQDENEK